MAAGRGGMGGDTPTSVLLHEDLSGQESEANDRGVASKLLMKSTWQTAWVSSPRRTGGQIADRVNSSSLKLNLSPEQRWFSVGGGVLGSSFFPGEMVMLSSVHWECIDWGSDSQPSSWTLLLLLRSLWGLNQDTNTPDGPGRTHPLFTNKKINLSKSLTCQSGILLFRGCSISELFRSVYKTSLSEEPQEDNTMYFKR